MGVLFTRMPVHHMPGACRGRKRASVPLAQELKDSDKQRCGLWELNQGFWKSSHCYPLSNLAYQLLSVMNECFHMPSAINTLFNTYNSPLR